MQVFPHAMVFGNTTGDGGYDGVMVGSAEPLDIDVSAIQAKLDRPEFAEVRQSLAEVNYPDAISLFGTFAADASQLSGYLQDAQINRDRNLRLQYLAGLGVDVNNANGIYQSFIQYRRFPPNVFTGSATILHSLHDAILGPGR